MKACFPHQPAPTVRWCFSPSLLPSRARGGSPLLFSSSGRISGPDLTEYFRGGTVPMPHLVTTDTANSFDCVQSMDSEPSWSSLSGSLSLAQPNHTNSPRHVFGLKLRRAHHTETSIRTSRTNRDGCNFHTRPKPTWRDHKRPRMNQEARHHE